MNPKGYFVRKRREALGRQGLSYPALSAEEMRGAEGFDRLFALGIGELVFQYPLTPLKVAVSPLLGGRLSHLIAVGDYERGDIELVLRHVRPGDSVLEIGAGAGVTAAASAFRSRRRVTVIDADKRLKTLVERQVQVNGGKCRFVEGCVAAMDLGEKKRLPFFIHPELWYSSLAKGRGGKKISVRTLALNDLLKRYRPSVVMMDIEGAELNLFDAELSHDPRLWIIELHSPIYGRKKEALMIERLKGLGYKRLASLCWTHVFQKSTR